jgi:hypothetical protein
LRPIDAQLEARYEARVLVVEALSAMTVAVAIAKVVEEGECLAVFEDVLPL